MPATAIIALAITTSAAYAQETSTRDTRDPDPAPAASKQKAPVSLQVKEVLAPKGGAGIGDRIMIEIVGLQEAVENESLKTDDLVLYLDGYRLKDIHAASVDLNRNRVGFQLDRTDSTRKVWTALLGRPKWSKPIRTPEVSVGLEDGRSFPPVNRSDPPVLQLIVFDRQRAVFYLVVFFIVLGLFVWLAHSSGIIRDSGPPKPPEGARKPYSLGRLQMAVWFFLVISSFVFIYLITGDYQTITEQALVLIGIGTGTALGSAAIDSSKRENADKELASLLPRKSKLEATIAELEKKQATLSAALAANPPGNVQDQNLLSTTNTDLAEKRTDLQETEKKIKDAEAGLNKPVSEGFIKDILTDVNGISFHRFQMLIWTIVLGFLFLDGVYKSLAMPEFSATLLALLGISAGTYLGFKIPERQIQG